MSNRRSRRRTAPGRREIQAAVIEASRMLRGCTCAASVIQRHVRGTTVAAVHHEPKCPALDRDPQARWLTPTEAGSER